MMSSNNKNFRSTPESTGFDRTKLILKHQMSGALDAWTSYSVDTETKTVEIEQRTPMATPFLSSSKIAELVVNWLPSELDVVAFNDDDTGSPNPRHTPWTLFVRLGEVRLRAVVWKHRPEPGGEPRSTVELYPVPEA